MATKTELLMDVGKVRFEGGNLNEAFTNLVRLGPNNKVSNLTSNQPLVLTITLPNGLFSGTVTLIDGAAKKRLAFKGALLQRQKFGAGLFLGTDQSGTTRFEPAP